MNEIKMADLEQLVKRFLVPGLEKATAAALTAAYETRVAANAGSGTPVTEGDRKPFSGGIMEAYYLVYGTINTTSPKVANSQP